MVKFRYSIYYKSPVKLGPYICYECNQGFFGPRVPVDNLDGGTVGVSYFGDMDLNNPVVVSPDAGGVYRYLSFESGITPHRNNLGYPKCL